MTIYETIKAAVPVRQAAEHYGLKVNRNGMACCPFHNDRHPSMKLNEDYYYCFSCGATGDVIDLVARLCNLGNYEAASQDSLYLPHLRLNALISVSFGRMKCIVSGC